MFTVLTHYSPKIWGHHEGPAQTHKRQYHAYHICTEEEYRVKSRHNVKDYHRDGQNLYQKNYFKKSQVRFKN